MPGGFHPFHAGHAALYKSAVEAFNDADVYVAATNDTKTRPFPFSIKEKLAKLAGVADKHFVQVKSPFKSEEITSHYNPDEDVLIFVRSEKDKNEQPKPGGTKKDGSPAYFQPWTGKNLQPFSKHAYIAYLPTVEFGPGITSATEIRNAWPTLNDKRKTAMVMSLYPVTQKNPKLAANVVKMLDMGMGTELAEGSLNEFVPPSSDGGGDSRSRRIRKLLEIAIQVAKEKNIDELGMIHGMNMIAGDEFFNTAVEGILPDITDKEYMFVLQSAYKTVKQGLAEAKKKRKKKSRNRSIGRYFFPGYGYYGGGGDSGEGGGDGGGEGMAEGSIGDKIKGASKSVKRATQGWGVGGAPDMVTPKGVVQAFGNMDGQRLANFVASRKELSKPGKDSARAFADKVIDREMKQRGYGRVADKDEQGMAEGDVVPFKQPSKTLTWDQVPRDVLLLANDWFWASEDNSGLDAVIDPKGYGNGTANDVKYLTAKLQQKGWTIDYNDENDGIDEYNLILTNKRGQKVLLSINDAQSFTGWASGTNPVNEGPFVQRITHPKKVSIYLKIGKGSKLVATDIPYEILDSYVKKVIQKYPQFKPTDFSFKSSDKVDENLGIPYPTTYEQENNKFKRRGPMRITAMTEFAPPGSDDREPDEEEILRQLAAQWWNGSMQQMKKAQQTLQAMGWEIGQDESGDEDAGVFVIRIGDENGDSYIAFPHSELGLNEDYLNEK